MSSMYVQRYFVFDTADFVSLDEGVKNCWTILGEALGKTAATTLTDGSSWDIFIKMNPSAFDTLAALKLAFPEFSGTHVVTDEDGNDTIVDDVADVVFA